MVLTGGPLVSSAQPRTGVAHAEAPSSLLYNFDGYLDHDGSKHALTASQLLLRGAILKNTAEVIGASEAAPVQAHNDCAS